MSSATSPIARQEIIDTIGQQYLSGGPVNYKLLFANHAPYGPPDFATIAESVRPFVLAAAVLVTFDPTTLRPLDPVAADDERYARAALLGYAPLYYSTGSDGLQWALRPEIRRRAIEELLERGRIEEALAANPVPPGGDLNTMSRLWPMVLRDRAPALHQLSLSGLSTLEQARDWVGNGVKRLHSLPDADALRAAQVWEHQLAPFRWAVGSWVEGEFREHFQGRASELRTLREYVDVADAHSLPEAASRFVRRHLSHALDRMARPPLLIYGPGGVGKTTLLAKFLLDHVQVRSRRPFPFVYLDFDRPEIRSATPAKLLIVACQQLAVQYPEIPFGRLGENLTSLFFAAGDEGSEVAVELATERQDDLQRAIAGIGTLLRQATPGGKTPCLFVLDPFEEVQYRSRDQVEAIYDLLADLQQHLPNLRVVLAGRAQVDDFVVEEMPLAELDPAAALSFLQQHGLPQRSVAEAVLRSIGRHPLSLVLAADLVRRAGLGEVAGLGKAARSQHQGWLGSLLDLFRTQWDDTRAQGILYERILAHIHDPRVRRLAHPGLVLRRITADLIQQVLAGPCEVSVADRDEADALLGALQREVALVTPAGDEPGVLRHRPDLRQLMLPLILQRNPEQARCIQEAAVAYYAMQGERTAFRAEEIYHRLMLGESPRSVEARWRNGIGASLGTSLDELPLVAQAFVAVQLGVDRPQAVWEVADPVDWERYAERRLRNLLTLYQHQPAALLVRDVRFQRAQNPTLRLLGLLARIRIHRDPLMSAFNFDKPEELRSAFAELRTTLGADHETAEWIRLIEKELEALGGA